MLLFSPVYCSKGIIQGIFSRQSITENKIPRFFFLSHARKRPTWQRQDAAACLLHWGLAPLPWLCSEDIRSLSQLCPQCRGPHHLWARQRWAPGLVCLPENTRAYTCSNRGSPACGFPFTDVGVTAARFVRVKGSGLHSKHFVVLCTSTCHAVGTGTLQRWVHAYVLPAPPLDLKIKQQPQERRLWKPGDKQAKEASVPRECVSPSHAPWPPQPQAHGFHWLGPPPRLSVCPDHADFPLAQTITIFMKSFWPRKKVGNCLSEHIPQLSTRFALP